MTIDIDREKRSYPDASEDGPAIRCGNFKGPEVGVLGQGPMGAIPLNKGGGFCGHGCANYGGVHRVSRGPRRIVTLQR